jgi:hypothetical protein
VIFAWADSKLLTALLSGSSLARLAAEQAELAAVRRARSRVDGPDGAEGPDPSQLPAGWTATAQLHVVHLLMWHVGLGSVAIRDTVSVCASTMPPAILPATAVVDWVRPAAAFWLPVPRAGLAEQRAAGAAGRMNYNNISSV